MPVCSKPPGRPVRVLQFGEGNFLRAFVDYMIDIANEKADFNGNVVLVKPISFGNLDAFHQQDCRYTVLLRGLVDSKPVEMSRAITSVSDAVDAYGEYEKYAAYARLDTLRDDAAVLAFFAENDQKPAAELTRMFLSSTDFFGQYLTQVPGLETAVATALEDVLARGMRTVMTERFGG